MHSHDFDLIAQFAEGSLLGEDVAAAESALETCAECRVEYDSQTLILEFLTEVEPARLTEFERARLHRGIVEATMEPVTQERRSVGAMAWIPKLAIAAAAVAFVGVVGVGLRSPGTPTDDLATESPATAGAAMNGENLAAEDQGPSDAAGAGAATESAVAEGDEFALEAPMADEGEESLRSLTESMTAPVQPLNLGEIDRESFADLTFERLSPGAVPDRSSEQQAIEPFPFACVGAAVGTYGEEEELNVAGVAVLEGQIVEILGFGDALYAFDPKTCDLVASEPLGG